MDITQVLPRRSDLSTFLIHLSRSSESETAKTILCKIIEENRLLAGSPFGHAVAAMQKANWDITDQKCVCFSEVPLEHLCLLTEKIEGRSVAMEPYGIAVTKAQARRRDVNPVWYIDQTKGRTWLSNPLNNIVTEAIRNQEKNHSILKLTPFIEQFGDYKDFHWEREWRSVGDFHLPPRYLVIAPESDHQDLKQFIKMNTNNPENLRLIDGHWGLEKTIAKIAGFKSEEL